MVTDHGPVNAGEGACDIFHKSSRSLTNEGSVIRFADVAAHLRHTGAEAAQGGSHHRDERARVPATSATFEPSGA